MCWYKDRGERKAKGRDERERQENEEGESKAEEGRGRKTRVGKAWVQGRKTRKEREGWEEETRDKGLGSRSEAKDEKAKKGSGEWHKRYTAVGGRGERDRGRT